MPTYLVTGAGRGLGYGFVQSLASNPTNIVVGLVRDKRATEARLKSDGLSSVHLVEADITDDDAVRRAAAETETLLGDRGLDVLINNATYVSKVTALKSMNEYEKDASEWIKDMRKSVEINVFGVVKTIFAFLPLVRKGTLKKIVTLSSGMGDIGLVNEAKISNAGPYAASKAALSLLVAKLAADYEGEGILLISLCPGLVDTAEGEAETLSLEDQARQMNLGSKFLKYAPGYAAVSPTAGADRVLAAIDRSNIADGFSGSFLSHNGTTRWT